MLRLLLIRANKRAREARDSFMRSSETKSSLQPVFGQQFPELVSSARERNRPHLCLLRAAILVPLTLAAREKLVTPQWNLHLSRGEHSSNVYTHNFQFNCFSGSRIPPSRFISFFATVFYFCNSYRTHFDLLITASRAIIKLQRKENCGAIEMKRCLFNCHFARSLASSLPAHLLTVITGKDV